MNYILGADKLIPMGFILQQFEPDLGTSVVWQNADNTKRISVFETNQTICFYVSDHITDWGLVDIMRLPVTESEVNAVIARLSW